MNAITLIILQGLLLAYVARKLRESIGFTKSVKLIQKMYNADEISEYHANGIINYMQRENNDLCYFPVNVALQ